MPKSILKTFIAFVISFFVFSCQKQSNAPPPTSNDDDTLQATSQKILGKWYVKNITRILINGTIDHTLYPAPGDYWNFTNDSILTYVVQTHSDAGYKLLPDDSAVLYYKTTSPNPTDTLFISTLTDHMLVLHGFIEEVWSYAIDSLQR